ncbi:G-protein coupled receptor dmsr-1-like [Physella acuta]|uniref:G-protein coupled receptor dmsr-1-like n=1 Tax=Physella acuta TaxID=109671 RepID=UPI0027DE68A6|nr:G-protein coupled receptor dmsr-1-like [Physella acuta]
MYLDVGTNWTSVDVQPLTNTSPCVCKYRHDDVPEPDLNGSWPQQEMSALHVLGDAYSSLHGVISLIVCAFGIPMNVLNITVLTRKHMRTPVNCILTWLAVFDLLTMVSYVPFSLHFYCLTTSYDRSGRNSWGWMTFLIFHVNITSTTHTISIWLGVTLAMFRYKHIFSPAKGHITRVRRLIRARIAVFVVVVVSILVMIPNYMMNKIIPHQVTDPETNVTNVIFVTENLNLGTEDVELVTQVNLWLHSALAKFLPCILMVVYGGLLVKTLRTNIRMLNRSSTTRTSDSFFPACPADASPDRPSRQGENFLTQHSVERKGSKKNNHNSREGRPEHEDFLCLNCQNQRLSQQEQSQQTTTTVVFMPSSSPSVTTKRASSSPLATTRRQSRHHDNSRTTRMLLIVITLFLVTELPQAILIVLSATIPNFFQEVYLPLGDIMDVVALINNGINFLLYCIMSRDFRTTLLDMMKSTMNNASKVPGKITTTFYRPTATVFDRSERSHATLIVRAKELSS